jgi:hypothetical protein
MSEVPVPEGWALVPRDPTQAMLNAAAPFPDHLRSEHPDTDDPWHAGMAGAVAVDQASAANAFRKMVEAAPAPPSRRCDTAATAKGCCHHGNTSEAEAHDGWLGTTEELLSQIGDLQRTIQGDGARIAKLEAALAPFADINGEGSEDFPDSTRVTIQFGRTTHYAITLGDFRRARAALSKLDQQERA